MDCERRVADKPDCWVGAEVGPADRKAGPWRSRPKLFIRAPALLWARRSLAEPSLQLGVFSNMGSWLPSPGGSRAPRELGSPRLYWSSTTPSQLLKSLALYRQDP